MGILSDGGSDEEIKEAETVYISGENFSIDDIGERLRDYIREFLLDKNSKVSKGSEIDLSDVDANFEVIYVHPNHSKITDSTNFIFKDRVYYRPAYTKFDIRDSRILEVEDEFDEEDDFIELRTPESFSNILQRSEKAVEHYPESNTWVCSSYYYRFGD
ncbi:hypothetical protein GLU60_00560 [Nanohaloarchaea archaeon H01]|nr:hypothetical protein [Nanohaloarchaea archaeon H01]